jgi:plastocyanin
MKKRIFIIIGIVAIIVAAGIGLFVVTRSSSSPATSMDMNNSNSSTNKPVETNTVTIQNFAFSPSDIAVKVGAEVTWTNNDTAPHTITETDGQTGPSSETVNKGSSYSFTFSKAGTYHYHCSIHTGMTGTVTVS